MVNREKQPWLVAVSGGVDSVVLLDILVAQADRPLIVAHVNHGIRADSDEDEAFVAELADKYGLAFCSVRLKLGPNVSEETARRARYEWLEAESQRLKASAVATAHHEDDIFETMIINLLRGTGWRGLASLRSTDERIRPLLAWSKAQVLAYALEHGLGWREDSTNESYIYLRNRVRHMITPRLGPGDRRQLRKLYDSQVELRNFIDTECQRLLDRYCENGQLRRYALVMIDDSLAYELLAAWLNESLERGRLRHLLLFAKTARPGARWSLDKTRFIEATPWGLIVLPSRD